MSKHKISIVTDTAESKQHILDLTQEKGYILLTMYKVSIEDKTKSEPAIIRMNKKGAMRLKHSIDSLIKTFEE